MVQLMCLCLNVHIDCVGPLSQDTPKLNLSEEQKSDKFFKNGFSEVSLSASGITQIFPCLCKSKPTAEWIVHECLNCKMPTHAVHSSKGLNRVLASRKLLSDRSCLKTLKQSDEYSPAFNMVITKAIDRNVPLNLPMHNPVVKAAVESMSLQVLTYFKEEEAAMEKRIKSYIDEQHKAFTSLREKANHDKQVLAAVVAKEAEHSLEQSLQSAAVDIADMAIQPIKSVNVVMNKVTAGQRQKSSSTIPTKSGVKSFTHKTAFDRHFSVPASDFDDMFAMEGLNEKPVHAKDSSPYYNSDDDGDTDESSLNDESYTIGSQLHDIPPIYATSLPINMPVWQRSRHSSEEDELAKQIPVPVDPQEMAASIKALARSVKYNDGTEMFGELPGYKMDTADVAWSRISTFNKKP